MSDPGGSDGTRVDGVRWIGVSGRAALRDLARRRVLEAAARALEQRARFLIVLAGGRTPRDAYRTLREAETDWSRWHVYFGDERCLPPTDAGRNSQQVAQDWLGQVPIPPGQVHTIPAEAGAASGARLYSETLGGVGDFDLVLLGLGEDGHTASLFPGREWNATPAADVVAVLDAPEPPPERVSMSAARLSRSREVLFLVEGERKRDAVARWLAGAPLPAAAIRPAAGVDVLVDAMLLAPPTGPHEP